MLFWEDISVNGFKISVLLLTLITVITLVFGNYQWNKEQEKFRVSSASTDIESTLRKNTSTDVDGLINLPKYLYQTDGEPLRIYYQNLIQKSLRDNYYLKVEGNETDKSQMKDYIDIKPVKGKTPIKFGLYEDGELIASDQTEIIVNKQRTNLLKGMLIGDSTIITNGKGYVTQRISKSFGENIQLFGTMGDGNNKYEGRGGWRAEMYRTPEKYLNQDNPFYNPEIEDFDFEYYIENQGYEDLDFVILNFGINDVFNYKSSVELNNDLMKIMTNYNKLIESIKEYDNNIRIALNLTIPPSSKKDSFNNNPEINHTQERVKENNFIWVKKMIEYYSESEDIDLVPIYTVIDTKENYADAVHPNVEGYNQIADQVIAYLNSL